ncbi:MAG: hypothetical protein JWQ63_3867 [Mucilaginibacter sp.]|jgi:CubicO group peptidase (beta-lactamase class C family)|nr:hypothetical protein [Mucilaginibacter sp.]
MSICNDYIMDNQAKEQFTFKNIIDNITDKLIGLPDQTELSIAVIKNKSLSYLGLLNNENAIKQIDNKNSAFEIGSVTKTFTANILAQIVIEGKVKLDDPIEQYIPFQLKNRPSITLKHLVSHTSGLPRLPDNFFSYPGYLEENPYLSYNEDRLITYLTQNLKLENLPGVQYNYSNLGAGLLSYVLSKIENKRFSEVVSQRIFKPLNMLHSAFNKDKIKTNLVKGIDKDGNFSHYWDGGILNGCLGIISTAADMSKFALDALNSENKVSQLQIREIAAIRPGVIMTIGWAGSSDVIKPAVYWHNGGTAGFAASMAFNRQKQTAVVLLSNIEPNKYNELIEPFVIKLL